MASLKDTVISGSLRVTDTIFGNKATLNNSLTITNTDAIAHILFNRSNYNYIYAPSGSSICFSGNSSVDTKYCALIVKSTVDSTSVTTASEVRPGYDNKVSLGSSSYKWSNVYATTFHGNLTGNVTGTASGNIVLPLSYSTSK